MMMPQTALAVAYTEQLPGHVDNPWRPFSDKSVTLISLGKDFGDWKLPERAWAENWRQCDEIAEIAIAHGSTRHFCYDPSDCTRIVVNESTRNAYFRSKRRYRDVTAHWCADADGGLLLQGESASGWTADCLQVVGYDPTRKTAASAHNGRDCLLTTEPTVIENLLACLDGGRPGIAHRGCFEFAFFRGICSDHFEHSLDDPVYGAKNHERLRIIRERGWSSGVYVQGALMKISLHAIARKQLIDGGVLGEKIHLDGVCPFEHADLHSNRGGDKTRSGIVVVNSGIGE